MKRDAESHAAEDKRKRELAEARNKAEHLVYETEKLMKEHAEKLDAGSKSAVESASAKVQGGREGGRRGGDQLRGGEPGAGDACSVEAHVRRGPGGRAAGAQPGRAVTDGQAAGGDENVIDAEFEKKA